MPSHTFLRALRFFVLLLTTTAAAVGCGGSAPEPPARSDPPSASVTFGHADLRDVAGQFEAGGVVRAQTSAALAARVMAPIARIDVRPGDRVRRGAVLVTLDAAEAHARVAAARAAASAARESARAAEADAQSAGAAETLARTTFDRISTLAEKQSATAQERDQAAATLSTAQAHVQAAHARLAAARATREAAEQAVTVAETAAGYTTLTAPFDAVVTARYADPGAMASPGTPILLLDDPSRFRLEVAVDEARGAAVSPGQTVAIRLDTTAGEAWTTASVVEVGRIDPDSHSVLVKVGVPETLAARSGLFGRVRFSQPARQALTAPASAVFRRGQLTFVFVVAGDGLARLRPVTTGAQVDDRVEVLAGLQAGDRVVASPPPTLIDGTRVAPASSSSSPSPGASTAPSLDQVSQVSPSRRLPAGGGQNQHSASEAVPQLGTLDGLSRASLAGEKP